MAPDRLETGAQCCFNKFDCRLFISKFSQFAFYLSFSLSVISKSLAQLSCRCCNHSVSVVLNVRFATNGMYVKNNNHIHVSQTSRNRMSTRWDVYCCLLPQCEALHTCRLGFPITTKWCFDQDVKVVPGATFTKRYVLSTMGVSKESISKFLIGNRFHVKLRILSPENCKQSLQVKS